MNIGEKKQAIIYNVFKEKKHIFPQEIYKKLFHKLSIKEAKQLAFFDFGNHFFSKKILSASPEIFQYLFIPSLACKADDFFHFFSAEKDFSQKKEFEKKYPIQTFYRAAILTPSQAENILQKGFVSSFLRQKKPKFSLLQTPFFRRIAQHAYSQIQTDFSVFISVSPFLEIAKYTAYRFFASQKNPPKRNNLALYVFPLFLRTSELISSEKFLPSTYTNTFLIHSSKKNGTHTIPFSQAEYWGEFFLPPEKIDAKNVQCFSFNEVLDFKLLSL